MSDLASRALVLLAAGVVLIAAGCDGLGATARPSALVERDQQLEELSELRMAREKALSEMAVGDLAGALEEDSRRGLEPWNSQAVREVERRGADGAPQLAELLRSPDRSSFLGLMAIRLVDRETYARLDPELRTAVLVDALATSQYFNAFGLPHLYWEEPARAIIDEGAVAESPLSRLLRDTRPAPMWGQEEVVEYEAYQYRVADYALALIRAIRGDEEPVPQDPNERDELIRQLQA